MATRRGEVRARVRVSGIRPGVVFLPFHYGYWDTPGAWRPSEHGRAANELTLTDWDPASKQPIFKTAACSVRKVASGDGTPSPAPDHDRFCTGRAGRRRREEPMRIGTVLRDLHHDEDRRSPHARARR